MPPILCISIALIFFFMSSKSSAGRGKMSFSLRYGYILSAAIETAIFSSTVNTSCTAVNSRKSLVAYSIII